MIGLSLSLSLYFSLSALHMLSVNSAPLTFLRCILTCWVRNSLLCREVGPYTNDPPLLNHSSAIECFSLSVWAVTNQPPFNALVGIFMQIDFHFFELVLRVELLAIWYTYAVAFICNSSTPKGDKRAEHKTPWKLTPLPLAWCTQWQCPLFWTRWRVRTNTWGCHMCSVHACTHT